MKGVLSDRAVLHITGEETRSFLQGLVTQDVMSVMTGAAVFSSLLTPQGKILFDFFLTPTDDGALIDCDRSHAPALSKRLSLYKLRAKVAINQEPGLFVALGEAASPVASYSDPRLAALPKRFIARGSSGPAIDDEYDALRLRLGAPEFGADFVGEEVFLLDVNYDALGGVDYKKGCFVGQEVTSRMKRKGEIRRRTLVATYADPAPAQGSPILAGDDAIGETLSFRENTGLAIVRVDRLKAAQAEGRALTSGGKSLQLAFPAYLEQG